MGQNGSGKSVLATAIARSWAAGPVLIYDPKDDPEAAIANATVARTARDVVRRLPGRVVYRPDPGEFTRRQPGDLPGIRPIWARFDECLREMIRLAQVTRQPSLVVVHELGDLGTPQACGPVLSEAIRKGRSLGITMVLITQRPVGIPVLVRSEAQHVAAFSLANPADRAVAAELMEDVGDPRIGPLIRANPLPLDHTWWYRSRDFRTVLAAPLPYRG